MYGRWRKSRDWHECMSSKKRSPDRQKIAQQARNNPTKYWNKPIGKIIIVVIGGVAVYFITLLIAHIWPPRENINRLEIPRSPYSGTVKMPAPGIYMKDVQMDNVGTGIKVEGTPPNMFMDNVQMKNVKEKGIDIDTSATKASQRKK